MLQVRTITQPQLACGAGLHSPAQVTSLPFEMGRTNHDQRSDDLWQSDERLTWAAKMESLGTVNSGVAHSLKNQLAQIQMGIEALRALRPMAEPTGDDAEVSVPLDHRRRNRPRGRDARWLDPVLVRIRILPPNR